jgi:hypothetical protein
MMIDDKVIQILVTKLLEYNFMLHMAEKHFFGQEKNERNISRNVTHIQWCSKIFGDRGE